MRLISSIEEPDDFPSDMSASCFFMGVYTLVGGDDQVSELSGWKDIAGPFLKIWECQVVSWTDHTALVNPPNELNHNLLASMVVDDLKLSDVAVLLHQLQELDHQVGDWSNQHLFLALPFGVDDCS